MPRVKLRSLSGTLTFFLSILTVLGALFSGHLTGQESRGEAEKDRHAAENGGEWAIKCEGVVQKFLPAQEEEGNRVDIAKVNFDWYVDSGGRWISREQQPQIPEVNRIITASNGTNVFQLLQTDKALSMGAEGGLKPKGGTKRVSTNADVARIGNRIQELPGANYTYFIWFAFLGANNIPFHQGEARVPPLMAGRAIGGIESFGYVAKANIGKRLIRSAEWRVKPDLMSYKRLVSMPRTPIPLNENRKSVRRRLRRLREGGRRNGPVSRYRLKTHASLGPRDIPIRALAERMGQQQGADESDVRVRMTLNVTNYTPTKSKRSVLPELRRRVAVDDLRFRTKKKGKFRNKLEYVVTNGEWTVSTNDERLEQALAGARPLLEIPATPNPGYRPILIGLCVAVLVFPLLIRWVYRFFRSGS